MSATSKLYVSNIPFNITVQDLERTFQEIGGVVSAKIITDKFSGRSKGFGFVEMESASLAKQAIEKLNGTEIMGRKMLVAEAKPQDHK